MERIKLLLEDLPKIEVTNNDGIITLTLDGTKLFSGREELAVAWAKGFATCAGIEW